MTNRILHIVLLPLLLLVSCREDISISDEVVLIDPGASISTTITGRVVDPTGNPISYATVTSGLQELTCDENGFFIFPNIAVLSGGVVVHASKYQYLDQTTRRLPIDGSDTYVEITLPWNYDFGNFLADEGGDITDSLTNVTLRISPNTLVDIDNVVYQGAVRSTIIYHDPNRGATVSAWPGNLGTIAKGGEMNVLGNAGMLQIDITTEDCRQLFLMSGAKASVSISTQSSSGLLPEGNIFSFDEEFGLWLEDEKVLQRDGDLYQFEIDKLGSWAYGIMSTARTIRGQVVDDKGLPAVHKHLRYAYRDGSEWVGTLGYTNSQGEYLGQVPANSDLEITISDPLCGIMQSIGMIGPFDTDAVAADLSYTGSDSQTIISGIVYDCTDEAAAGALVYLFGNNSRVLASSVVSPIGSFSLTTDCPSDLVRVMVYDPVTDLSGASGLLEGLAGDQEIGEIIVCNQPQSFLSVTSEIGNSSFDEPQLVENPNTGNFEIFAETEQSSFRAVFARPDLMDNNPIEVAYSNINLSISCNDSATPCSAVLSAEISEYTAEIIVGKISGELYLNPDDLTQTRKMEATFRVRR